MFPFDLIEAKARSTSGIRLIEPALLGESSALLRVSRGKRVVRRFFSIEGLQEAELIYQPINTGRVAESGIAQFALPPTLVSVTMPASLSTTLRRISIARTVIR